MSPFGLPSSSVVHHLPSAVVRHIGGEDDVIVAKVLAWQDVREKFALRHERWGYE